MSGSPKKEVGGGVTIGPGSLGSEMGQGSNSEFV